MRKTILATLLLGMLASIPGVAQTVSIDNFLVKQSLTNTNKIAIIAADSAGTPREDVNGLFTFTINGFKEQLLFTDGVATPGGQIDKSAFVYLKHRNDRGTHSVLYYVIKANGDLNPFRINWMLLLIVPVTLIVLGMMFRKFIIIALILLVGLFIFNHTRGLGFLTFFENIYNGIKAML